MSHELEIGDIVLVKTWSYPALEPNNFKAYEGEVIAIAGNFVKIKYDYFLIFKAEKWFNIFKRYCEIDNINCLR